MRVGEKKEQLTARGVEKPELWRGSGPSCMFCTEDGSRTPSAQMLPPRLPLQTSFPSLVWAPIICMCSMHYRYRNSYLVEDAHFFFHILTSLKLDCVLQSLASDNRCWPDGIHDVVVIAWCGHSCSYRCQFFIQSLNELLQVYNRNSRR